MSPRYQKVEDGQRVQPKMRGYRMMCCDCGLVHRLNFYIVVKGRRRKVQFKAWRDYRSTAATRRRFERIRVIKGPGAK